MILGRVEANVVGLDGEEVVNLEGFGANGGKISRPVHPGFRVQAGFESWRYQIRVEIFAPLFMLCKVGEMSAVSRSDGGRSTKRPLSLTFLANDLVQERITFSSPVWEL